VRAPVLIALSFLIAAAPLAAQSKGKKKTAGKKGQESVEALIKSGESAYTAGDFEGALASFKKAVKKFPDDARGYYYCGVIYAEQGKKDDAEAMYRASLGLEPVLPEAVNNLAVLVQEKKAFKEAEQMFLKALEAAPDYFEAQYNLGYLYEEWNKPSKAVEAYLKAAKLNAKDTDALIAVAEIQSGRGQNAKAVEAYRKAVKRNGALAALKIEIASLLTKMGKKDEAAVELESLLSMVTLSENADLTVPFKAARGLRLAGKPKKALEVLSKFPSKAKGTFSVLTETALCQKALGDCSKAVKTFMKAYKLKPDSPELLLALGDASLCAKKCKDAKAWYGKFLEKTEKGDARIPDVKKKIKSCK
jgi:Flp pilus assembly protein TadD